MFSMCVIALLYTHILVVCKYLGLGIYVGTYVCTFRICSRWTEIRFASIHQTKIFTGLTSPEIESKEWKKIERKIDWQGTVRISADVKTWAALASCAVKPAFHDTDTDSNSPDTPTSLRPTRAISWSYSCGKLNDTPTFSRGCRRRCRCRCRRRGMRALKRIYLNEKQSANTGL